MNGTPIPEDEPPTMVYLPTSVWLLRREVLDDHAPAIPLRTLVLTVERLRDDEGPTWAVALTRRQDHAAPEDRFDYASSRVLIEPPEAWPGTANVSLQPMRTSITKLHRVTLAAAELRAIWDEGETLRHSTAERWGLDPLTIQYAVTRALPSEPFRDSLWAAASRLHSMGLTNWAGVRRERGTHHILTFPWSITSIGSMLLDELDPLDPLTVDGMFR